MKKLFSLILTILVIFSLFGCEKKIKTTVHSKEEWDELYSDEKYNNVEMTEIIGIPGKNEYYIFDVKRDNNKVYAEYRYEKEITDYYYFKNEEDLSLTTYTEIGSNAFDVYVSNYNSKEELDIAYEELLVYLGLVPDYKEFYEKAEYLKDKGCYRFRYGHYNEVDDADIELYLQDDYIIKKVFFYELGGKQRADINTYSNFGEVVVNEPENVVTVNNEDEWKALFSQEKYKNCSLSIVTDEEYTVKQISENIIHSETRDQDYVTLDEKYYIRQTENKGETVATIKDGTVSQVDLFYPTEESLTCFEDHFLYEVFDRDYSNYFNDIKFVDNHYELQLNENGLSYTFKFYISNSYLYRIEEEIVYKDGNIKNKTISIADFGITTVDVIKGVKS